MDLVALLLDHTICMTLYKDDPLLLEQDHHHLHHRTTHTLNSCILIIILQLHMRPCIIRILP